MMAFGDHLEELRRRLLFALALIVPVFVLLFLGWQTVLSFLVAQPLRSWRHQEPVPVFSCSGPRRP